jgi:hypothetical protein
MKEIVKNLESEVTELKAKDVEMREKVTELENKIRFYPTCYKRKTNALRQQPILNLLQ